MRRSHAAIRLRRILVLSNKNKGGFQMPNSKSDYSAIFKDYPDVVDVNELCQMLGGISKKLAYRLLTSNQIQSVKIGRTYKIPKVFIVEYLVPQNHHDIWTSGKGCGSVCGVNGR